MGEKSKVRPGLGSPDQSQDVEFTIDQQIDQGQHERDEKERGGALGPARQGERYKPDPRRRDVDDGHETPKKAAVRFVAVGRYRSSFR